MCYEQWSDSRQVTRSLEQARREAEKMIEQARAAPRPEPEKETSRKPEPATA